MGPNHRLGLLWRIARSRCNVRNSSPRSRPVRSPTLERMWSNEPPQEQTTPSRDNASLPLVTDFGAEQGTPIGDPMASQQRPMTPTLRMPNASRTCSKVYSRRRVQVMVTAPVETSATEGTSSNPPTLATLTPTSSRWRSSFMAKITKKTQHHALQGQRLRLAHLRLLHVEADRLRVLSLNHLLDLQQGTRRR